MWLLEGREEFKKALGNIKDTEGGVEEIWEKMRDKIREVIDGGYVEKDSGRIC